MITCSSDLHMMANRGVTMCNVDHLYTIWLRGCQQYIYLEQHTTKCDSTRSIIVELVEYNKYILPTMITDKGDHHQITCCLEGQPHHSPSLDLVDYSGALISNVLDDRLWSTHDWFKHSTINMGLDRMTVAWSIPPRSSCISYVVLVDSVRADHRRVREPKPHLRYTPNTRLWSSLDLICFLYMRYKLEPENTWISANTTDFRDQFQPRVDQQSAVDMQKC